MPRPNTDEEEQQAPVVTTADGQNPIVPSAPDDAQQDDFAPTVYPKPPSQAPLPPVAGVPPKPPRRGKVPMAQRVADFDASQQHFNQEEQRKKENYGRALDRFNADQMYQTQRGENRRVNAEVKQDYDESHVETRNNPETGNVEAARDDKGNVRYRPGKGPVQYDDQGHAVQTQFSETGPTTVQLDKDAAISPTDERPNELYRQNKHSPWEYLGTVQEGLASKDPTVKKAAEDAQLGLDKRLHKEVAHDLAEEVSNRSLAVQTKLQDYRGKSTTLRGLVSQYDNFDKDHPGVSETDGGFWTGGAQPTEQAQALKQQKESLGKQIEDLQTQGYSASEDPKLAREHAKDEIEALKVARSDNDSWLAPKEPGDFDRLIQNRSAALSEQGLDPAQDKILQSLQRRKDALGIKSQSSSDRAPGMVEPGNLDLKHRPVVQNDDGTVSTVRSASVNIDGREVLIPTVAEDGSGILSTEQAIDQYKRTGKHLGIFTSVAAANKYAEQLHQEQAARVDPITGPVIAERESLDADEQAVSHNMAQVQGEYEKRLAPLAGQIQQFQAQTAPLKSQEDRLQGRLEQLVGMPAMVKGEDPDARRRETSLRVGQLKDGQTKIRAQTILNALEPISSELRRREYQMQPTIDAHDQLASQAQAHLSQLRADAEREFTGRRQDLAARTENVQAIQALRQSQQVLSLLNATLFYPTSPEFAADVATAKDEADRQRARQDPWSETFEPGNFERGLVSGAGKMLGEGIKGLAQFSESIDHWASRSFPSLYVSSGQKAETSRALSDLIMKVPGVMEQDADVNSGAFKTGSFLGSVGLGVGEGAINPAILIPQFFGQGYHGQVEAAQAYFDKKAQENPMAPRDVEAEQAAIEKAGVLGGSVNAVLAVPFGSFGKIVNKVFGSTRANVISSVLKKSYETGGIEAVANDLRVLQAAITKTAGREAFKEVAQKSLEGVIEEITKTPLQRIGQAAVKSATDAALFGGVQAAQNLVTRTYNPKTGLFENVPSAAGQGAVLGAFFGAVREASAAQRASEARTKIGAEVAKRVYPTEPGAPGEPGPALPPEGSGGGGRGPQPAAPTTPRVTPEEAHREIDGLQPSEAVKPEQVAGTQNALRGLVKISQGQPMDSLTTVERTAIESETADGLGRVEMVKGKPVITDATLERVRQIAPTTAQLLPQNEEGQRQAILNPVEETGAKSGSVETTENQPSKKTEEISQPTFSVQVQTPGGETREVEVTAADEKTAKSQVAQTIQPGEGLITDVTQTTSPQSKEATQYVPPEHFESHVIAQIEKESGQTLTPEQREQVGKLVRVAAPAYERWSKAFQTVNATLAARGTAGASFQPREGALSLSLPDLARHAQLYSSPESGEALIRHEAAHAVTTASGAKVVDLFKTAPESLKAAMREAYQVQGATDYNFAHELWAYVLAGKVELAAGRKIRLAGKFLPEQANRAFIVKFRRAFGEVLRFTRDMEGYLRRRGVSEDVIAQWKELEQVFVSKIREVDAAKTGKDETNAIPAEQIGGSEPARAPPPTAGAIEPTGGETSPESPQAPVPTGRDAGGPETEAETAPAETGPSAGTELSPENKQDLATGLNLPVGAIGHTSKVISNGMTVNVVYVAQEAALSRTSHDAQGRPTSGYDQSLQPRDRSLPSYRKQAQNLANTLDFSKVSFFPETKVPATTPDMGAPIMMRSGETLIGNGREIGITLAYDQGTRAAAKYRTDFIRNARTFGIEPAVVRDMKQPILKRVIIDGLPKEELVKFSQQSNQSTAMQTNATELAGQDASRLTPELLSLFDPNFSMDAARNQDFMRAFTTQVIKAENANEANLTGAELERRVRGAVFTYAYGADAAGRAALERLSQAESTGGKKISTALLTVAPIVARMKTDIASGDLHPLDISPAIARAAQDISEALRNKPSKQTAAAALKALRDQGSFETDRLERSVLEFFLDNRTNKSAIEAGISNYVESVFAVGNPKNGQLFDSKVPTPLDLFQRATTPKALEGGELGSQAIASPRYESQISTKGSQVSQGDIEQLRESNLKRLGPMPVERKIAGPVLVDREGKVFARGEIGKTHKDLADDIIKDPGSSNELVDKAIDAGTSDELHKFEDNEGNVLTREEAAPVAVAAKQAPHGTSKLQSQYLTGELKSQPVEGESNETTTEIQRQSEAVSAEKGSGAQPEKHSSDVGGGKPASTQEVIPTLRKGENQGDLLSKQTEEFSLVGEKGVDYAAIQAAQEKAIKDRAESAKDQLELFSQSFNELPERMQEGLRAMVAGRSVEGTSPAAVARLAREGLKRMSAKVKDNPSFTVLSNLIDTELRAQETNDPLKQLMASIDRDVLGDLFKKAEKEKPSQFETGRPDLALGAEGAAIRAAHQFHNDTFEAQTIEGWDETANQHLSDPAWRAQFANDIIRRYLTDDNLKAWETRAAMRLIAADSHALGTPEQKLEHAVRSFAYARLRSRVGQELASGRDPFKTPEERGREFLSKTFFRLSPEKEAEIEAEPDPAKREEKMSAALKERIDKLEKAFSFLSDKGVTLDDIFNGSWELHGKGKKFLEQQMSGRAAREQQALKLAQTGTRSATEIAKQTGLSVKDVERINDEFIDQLEKELTEKVKNGLTLESMDVQQTLLAQPTEGGAVSKTPEQIKAEVRRIIRGMGFVSSKDLGKFKVAKRKKKKIFVPPPPSQHIGPAPTEEPVPFEERRQNQLAFEEHQRMRNVNPKPGDQVVESPIKPLSQKGLPLDKEMALPQTEGPIDERTRKTFFPEEPRKPNESAEVPYPEGQAAPYTGRVLGQTGLPLYQEMMIRRGADMGSMDDLIKIGRVAQSIDAKPFDMAYEAWINNIFSGPGTHVANLSGNSVDTVMNFTLQRGVEALLNTLYRDADSASLGEFKYIARGIMPGLMAGLQRATRAWNTESSVFSRDVMNEQAEILEALDKSGGVPPAIPGNIGRAIRFPVRALLFEDEIFKSLIGQMEVGAQAYRIAKAEGLSGDKMSVRINELMTIPGSKAWARAVEKAIYLTYQEPTGLTALFRDQGKSAALGKMAAKAQSEGRDRTANVLRTEEMVVRNLYRAAGFFFPVIRTTYNIYKVGFGMANVLPTFTTIPYRLTRAGFYSWKKGKPFVDSYSKAQQIRDFGKQIIAWTTFGLLWGMVSGDDDDEKKNLLLTGSMPFTQTKKGERELNERAYGGTYMLRIGGRNGLYVPYGRVEPIATVLGTVADVISNIKKAKHGQSLADTGDALIGYFLAQAQSKTFLQGFGDLTKALEGSSTFLDVPKKLLLQSFVPNLIRQPLRALDEWERENKTALNIYQTLPVGGLAEKKIDVYGRPIAKGGNAFSRVFLSPGVKPDAQLEKADRLLINWNREHPSEAWAPSSPLGIYHDAAGKTQRMTGPELTKFREVSGKAAAERLRSEITEAQIRNPKIEDVKLIQKIFENAHDETKRDLFPKNRINQVRAAFEKKAA